MTQDALRLVNGAWYLQDIGGQDEAKNEIAGHTDRYRKDRENRRNDKRLARHPIECESAIPAEREKATYYSPHHARFGKRLSKLADAFPAVVRSEEEQAKHVATIAIALPILQKARAEIAGNTLAERDRRQSLLVAIRNLVAPMFGIRFVAEPSTLYYVSGNVLSDYKREAIDVEVVSVPERIAIGSRGMRRSDINLEYVAQFVAARSNDHSMGRAQTAWRFAHLERDRDAERVAYFWLYHGTLRPCKDDACKGCTNKRRLQARELTALAFRYMQEQETNRRASRQPTRAHKMAPPDAETLATIFGGWRKVERNED